MKEVKTVSVDLDIGDLMSLIEYCHKMADSIPKEVYDRPTAAGTTFRDTVKKYRNKAYKFSEILNETWPK